MKRMSRLLKVSSLLGLLMLAGCGFHLRQSVALPPSMQHIHLAMGSGGDFQRELARALTASGVTVEDQGGSGIAELRVPQARFSTDTQTVSSYSRVTEYAVHYDVRFDVVDSAGRTLLPPQTIAMQRSYSYDATNTIGNDSQVQQIQQSLNDDMVQAILFRLQAAAKRADAGLPPSAAAH
jgi:LPS-assembly lipoprotein